MKAAVQQKDAQYDRLQSVLRIQSGEMLNLLATVAFLGCNHGLDRLTVRTSELFWVCEVYNCKFFVRFPAQRYQEAL